MNNAEARQLKPDTDAQKAIEALEGARRSERDPDVELARMLVELDLNSAESMDSILRRLVDDENRD